MIRIMRESPPDFGKYASVSIAFEVQRVLDVPATLQSGSEGMALVERMVSVPYVKDYDALRYGHPTSWPRQFDTTNWAVFAAYDDDERIGGAVGVMDPPELDMLEARTDLAVLWDIRIDSASRGKGVGASLLDAVEQWARERGARTLKVETQDINVPACRFYERNGFRLRAVNRHAYPELPDETQLLWYKDLRGKQR